MQPSKLIAMNFRLFTSNSLRLLHTESFLCNSNSSFNLATKYSSDPGLAKGSIQLRQCSSDLQQRGLRSLIPQIDKRIAENLKSGFFPPRKAPRKKDKYLEALAACPEAEEGAELVETHLQSRNRNPRNMELMGYNKPRGYGKLHHKRNFWNRLNIMITKSHTTAYVDHHTGKILVSASTQEFSIARHLWRNTDTCALVNVGRVLAQRCKECGIDRVYCRLKAERKKEKVQAFFQALRDGGLRLTEPKVVVLPHSVVTDPVDFKPKKKKIKHFSAAIKRKHTYT